MDKLKEKNSLELCINLDEYEAKLEQLSILAQKMSAIDWTIESAIQFCKDQGMQIEESMLHQFATLQSLYDDLNTFNYKEIEDIIDTCKQQIEELRREKFDSYNDPYKNHINNVLSEKNKHLDAFRAISVDTKRIDNYLRSIVSLLSQLVKLLAPNVDDLFKQF